MRSSNWEYFIAKRMPNDVWKPRISSYQDVNGFLWDNVIPIVGDLSFCTLKFAKILHTIVLSIAFVKKIHHCKQEKNNKRK